MLKQLDTAIAFVVVISVVSLLITVITQMISALLGLRGKNLADALEAMIDKIDPNINRRVSGLSKKLTDQVLTRPVLSDSMLSMSKPWPVVWKRASAIRADELLQILEDIAGTTGVPAEGPGTAAQAAAELLSALDQTTNETRNALAALNAQLPALAAEKGAAVINELNLATNVTLRNLESWFNSAQDRAQQWFAIHTRVVTIVASLVAAFVLQLDSLQLIRRISSNPDMGASLASAADSLRAQAESALKDADPVNPSIHQEVVKKPKTEYPQIGDKLNQPPKFTVLSEANDWIGAQLSDDPKKDQILRPVLAEHVDRSPRQTPVKLDT